MLESSPIWDFFREIPAILRRPVYLGPWLTPTKKRERLRKRTLARKNKMEVVEGTVSSTRIIEGTVTRGSYKEFCIEGVEFTLAKDAWVIGNLEVGCIARVRIPPQTIVDDCPEVTTVTVLQSPL